MDVASHPNFYAYVVRRRLRVASVATVEATSQTTCKGRLSVLSKLSRLGVNSIASKKIELWRCNGETGSQTDKVCP